jgi:predicted amidohydrolase YtcJ
MFDINFDLPRLGFAGLVMVTARTNRNRSNSMSLIGALSILLSAMPALAQDADLVLRGGKVVTVDGSDTIAEAVAVVGNRIAAVGSTEAIEAYIGPGTRIVELNGRTLLPGFIDAHNHVEGSAAGQFFRLPVSVPPLETAEDVLKKVQQRASELPPGTWIEGQGTYYQPMPTREQLDTAIPDHPVVIRWSAHDVIANSKAMEMSGIDRNTPDPAGGHIERGPDGEPTGIFRDARQLLDLPQPTYEDKLRAIPLTLRELWLENGVTSVYTMDTPEGVRALQELRRRGELPPVRLSISFMLGRFDLDDGGDLRASLRNDR